MADLTIHIHHIGLRDDEEDAFPVSGVHNGSFHLHLYDTDDNCTPHGAQTNADLGQGLSVHRYMVSDFDGSGEFYRNLCARSSSLIPPATFGPQLYTSCPRLGDCRYEEAFLREATFTAPVIRLDTLARETGSRLDFLALHVQGDTDRALRGCGERLARQVVGVRCAVELQELHHDQALFGDIHALMRQSGFQFMRLSPPETQGDAFRAGIGFRGDARLLSARALFLKDPAQVEKHHPDPWAGLVKLAYIALSCGFVEYALDCLARLADKPEASALGAPEALSYVAFLAEVWALYRATPFIPQPSLAGMFASEAAQNRFEAGGDQPWRALDREGLLRRYFASVDVEAFRRALPGLLDPADSAFEACLRRHGLGRVAGTVKDKRLGQASLTVESLGLGVACGQRYRLDIEAALRLAGIAVEPLDQDLSPAEIAAEAQRLSRLSGWADGPSQGWQYPFDLGHGIVTPTYSDLQARMNPWRKEVLLRNLDAYCAGRYAALSVLDLGACEGSMALALWERGVRDITCVEIRDINVAKARFVFKVKHADIVVIQQDVLSYLEQDARTYDIVLFMGLLYHMQDPFLATRLAAARCRGVFALETVVALPQELSFDNDAHYSPTQAGFFIRQDRAEGNTAGLRSVELWPDARAIPCLLREAGFENFRQCDYGPDPLEWYASGQRTMMLAWR